MDNQQIKQAGLKVTLPRVKILRVLETSEQRHLSAEEVYRALLAAGEMIGLATVYRVLTQFEAVGLVCRHHFEGGQSVFELNRGAHHDHLVCVQCGRVVEFCDDTIETRQREIARQHGFDIVEHALVIYGTCGGCELTEGPGVAAGPSPAVRLGPGRVTRADRDRYAAGSPANADGALAPAQPSPTR